MGFLLSRGKTILDNAEDLQAVLSLPDKCVKAYLFLFSRRNLRPANRRAHWGEVAAAIQKGQTQTHAALAQLVELGFAETDGHTWACVGDSAESRRKSPGTSAESRRKSAMTDSVKTVQDEEKQAPEVREVREVRETKKKDMSPDGDAGQEEIQETSQADQADELLSLWNAHRGSLPQASMTAKRRAKLTAVARKKTAEPSAREIWHMAVLEVAADPYWRKHRYGLDNLLAGEKWLGKAESYRAKHPGNLRLSPAAEPAPRERRPDELPVDGPHSLAILWERKQAAQG